MMWTTKTLKRIIAAHKAREFPFNEKGFALSEGETHEQGFERLEGELATANTALTAAKEAGGKGFIGSLSEEIRNNPSMLKFKDKSNEEVAKSYIELQGKIGAKGVIIPPDGAPQTQIDEFFKLTGRPDTADAYQLVLPQDLHEGVVSTPESQKISKDWFHEAGLNSKQAQFLHSKYMTALSDVMKQEDVADKKAADEATTALRSRLGTTYDDKLALAIKVVNKFGGEKAQEFLDKGLGNDPAMIEMLINIGEKFSEDVLGPGGKNQMGAMTPAAAQAKIDEIRANAKHPYNDGASPLHKEAVKEMETLYQIKVAGAK